MNRMGSPVLQRFWCILVKARKEHVRENDQNTFSFFFFLPDFFLKPVVFSLILLLPSSHLCLGATCYGFFSDRACQNRDMVRPFEKCQRREALLPNRIRRPLSSSWTRVDRRLSCSPLGNRKCPPWQAEAEKRRFSSSS